MVAQCMRHAAVGVAVLAGTLAGHAQAPDPSAIYRQAIATYVKTGDTAAAVKPLGGWDQQILTDVVKQTILTGDSELIEAAAMLHLDVGVAVAGMSKATSELFFDLGAQLVDGLVPINPAVARALPAEKKDEIANVRATWLGVAGSAYLSVNDVFAARPLFVKASKLAPKSPMILTLRGIADEIDGAIFNPDDVSSVSGKRRAEYERTRLLVAAEEFYKQALEIDPEYPLAQIRRGRVYFLTKNPKQAGEWLAKGRAAAIDPAHKYLAAMFSAALLQDQKDLTGARAAYEEALTIAPSSQNATVGLAYLELMAGRPDNAQALARSYTGSASPDDSWWAYKNGTLDQAGLRWLRKRVRK
jgi:tetratricopeptide (TPR) repeat protein